MPPGSDHRTLVVANRTAATPLLLVTVITQPAEPRPKFAELGFGGGGAG